MPPSAVGLLVLAAAMHATWNLFVKRSAERQIFTWWSLVVGSVLFTPVLFIVASGAIEAAYFFALTRAYRLGDFSLVYPLARGAAPAFLLTRAGDVCGRGARNQRRFRRDHRLALAR